MPSVVSVLLSISSAGFPGHMRNFLFSVSQRSLPSSSVAHLVSIEVLIEHISSSFSRLAMACCFAYRTRALVRSPSAKSTLVRARASPSERLSKTEEVCQRGRAFYHNLYSTVWTLLRDLVEVPGL